MHTLSKFKMTKCRTKHTIIKVIHHRSNLNNTNNKLNTTREASLEKNGKAGLPSEKSSCSKFQQIGDNPTGTEQVTFHARP